MRGLLTTGVALAALVLPGIALAQDSATPPKTTGPAESPSADVVTGDMPPPIPTDMPITDEQVDATQDPETQAAPTSGAQVYTPRTSPRFAPRSALDMLGQVPGFTIITNDQGRGLGQASDNVIINGERVASKSESLFDVLQRIPTARVVRIEIVDGATLSIPGLSGQVANVVTKGGAISGRYEWRWPLAAAVRQDELRRRRGLGQRLDSASRLEPRGHAQRRARRRGAATAARRSTMARGT
jgi:outer membrane cobalamin receptor